MRKEVFCTRGSSVSWRSRVRDTVGQRTTVRRSFDRFGRHFDIRFRGERAGLGGAEKVGEFLEVRKGEHVKVERKAPNRSQYARTCWKDVKRL